MSITQIPQSSDFPILKKTAEHFIASLDEEETQDYFSILDKTNGENQWNSYGINQKAAAKERVNPSNLMG